MPAARNTPPIGTSATKSPYRIETPLGVLPPDDNIPDKPPDVRNDRVYPHRREFAFLLGDDGAGHGAAQWSQGHLSGVWQGLTTKETTRSYGDIDRGAVLAARLTPDEHQTQIGE